MSKGLDPPPAWATEHEWQLLGAIGAGVELSARDRRMVRWLARHGDDTVEGMAALLSRLGNARASSGTVALPCPAPHLGTAGGDAP
jgi:hypothetical protein